jgi:hypothetical protein
VRKGAEGLKDEQVTFLNTSVQALQSFVSVLAESTSTASPGVTARKQIQDELDSVLQHLQSIIFSAKSLLLAAGRPPFLSFTCGKCLQTSRASAR